MLTILTENENVYIYTVNTQKKDKHGNTNTVGKGETFRSTLEQRRKEKSKDIIQLY